MKVFNYWIQAKLYQIKEKLKGNKVKITKQGNWLLTGTWWIIEEEK